MKSFKIGTDPEFLFLKNGRPISAIDVLPSKEEPMYLYDESCLYWDNLLMEFRVKPADNRQDFIDNIGMVLYRAADKLAPFYTFKAQASHEFDEDAFKDPRAFEVGCRPEFCVHSKDAQGRIGLVPPPVFDESSRLRSCGGHIHLGHPIFEQDPFSRIKMVQLLDLVVGVTSVLVDKDPTAKRRREIYGGAGYHRPTPYGVEYRTPSNFWLASPSLTGLIYDLVEHTFTILTSHPSEYQFQWSDDIQTAINTHNKELALKVWGDVIHEFNLFPEELIYSVEKEEAKVQPDLYSAWGISVNAVKLSA